MTIEALFKKRRSRYLKDIIKYAKIIMNDHFVLLLFLLVGAGGFAYSSYLDSLAFGQVEPRILLVVLYGLFTATSSVTLLLEPADQVFLLPKEQAYKKIFKESLLVSFLVSLIPIAVLSFITFPLLVATMTTNITDMLLIFLTLSSLKGLQFISQAQTYLEINKDAKEKQTNWVLQLVKISLIVVLLFVNIPITTIAVVLLTLVAGADFLKRQLTGPTPFKWHEMIEAEEKRMQRLYRFIGMFVNVPSLQTNIKRLRSLDRILNWVSQKNPTATYYFAVRLLARHTEYSMLVIRALLVGALLVFATESLIVSSALVMLFLYVIGFQLLPLVQEMERLPQFQMYPIAPAEKAQAVFRLVFQVLFFSTLFLTFISALKLGLFSLGILLFGLLFSYLFSFFYAPRRLER